MSFLSILSGKRLFCSLTILLLKHANDVSKYEAKKTEKVIVAFLNEKLKLAVNAEKSDTRKPVQFTIQGYRFVPTYEKGTTGKYQLVVSEKSWDKLKQSLKAITGKRLR